MAQLNGLTADQLLRQPWSREFVPDGDLIAARVPELPGCFASGETWDEAHGNLEEALRSWLISAVELGNEIPLPRGAEEPEEYSGRFSVRIPRSLHRRLVDRADAESCSLNQLVTTLLAETIQGPVRGQKEATADAHEEVAADAVAAGAAGIGALKGIGTFLRNRGDINLACVLYSFAAERVAVGPGGAQEAAKEFGTAGALARRERRMRLAEALWRRSLSSDITNIRSNSSLGQLLHHEGRYAEAVEFLERAASVDSYARLFLGWSKLQLAVSTQQDELVSQGLDDLTDALRQWAAYASQTERTAWLRQVRRLHLLGPRFRREVEQLVHFANSNANWSNISLDELADGSRLDEDNADAFAAYGRAADGEVATEAWR